jgi:hypothetical protein
MHRSHPTVLDRRGGVVVPPRKRVIRSALLAIIALVAVTLMAVPGNATFAKKYDLVIAPPSATAGGSATFTATYTNRSLYKIGSTDLNVPAGFTITAASSTKGYPVTFTSTKVSVRNLAIALNYSFTITVTATIACSAASPGQWTAVTMTGTTSLSGSPFSINNPGTAQKTAITGCPQTIEVTKYDDVDVNGWRNGEPALSGWMFDLRAGTATSGVPIASQPTVGGTTSFTVSPGQYTVCEQLQAGWKNTDPGTVPPCETVTVTGAGGASLAFGNAQDVSIDVTKYEDTNLSGGRDEGEPTLEGWEITLYDGESTLDTQLTGADGIASFTAPAGGTYTVCETIPAGWTNTDPVDGSGCRTITSDQTTSGASISRVFGNAQGVGELGCPVGTPGFPNTDNAGGDGTPAAALTRFNNADGSDCVVVPYIFETGNVGDQQFVDFIKNVDEQPFAQFTLSITWDPELDTYPVTRTTQVDVDGPGGAAPVDLEWCDPRTGATPPAQLYELPTTVPWCLVSQSSTMDSPDIGENPNLIQVTEVIYGLGDPRLVR